jgi:hypothetical protein
MYFFYRQLLASKNGWEFKIASIPRRAGKSLMAPAFPNSPTCRFEAYSWRKWRCSSYLLSVFADERQEVVRPRSQTARMSFGIAEINWLPKSQLPSW